MRALVVPSRGAQVGYTTFLFAMGAAGLMEGAEPTREDLIRELWPDKALYGATLLFMTGVLGLLHALSWFAFDLSYSARVPAFIAAYPGPLVGAMSLAAVVLAALSLRRRSSRMAVLGCVAGVLSFGFLGLNALVSLVALAFILRSREEGEDTNPETLRLTPSMWPDKTLAAGLVLGVNGALTMLWGVAVAFSFVSFSGYGLPAFAMGLLFLMAGLVGLVAARETFHQRGRGLAIVGALVTTASLAVWVVGPVFGLAALVLIVLGEREREFHDAPDPTI